MSGSKHFPKHQFRLNTDLLKQKSLRYSGGLYDIRLYNSQKCFLRVTGIARHVAACVFLLLL